MKDVPVSFTTFRREASSQPIYVILGVQGSGTNLLRSILDRAFNFSVVQDQSLVFNSALRLGARPSPEAVEREFKFLRARLLPSALTRKTRRRIKSNGSFVGIDQHFGASQVATGADLARFIYTYAAFSRGTTRMAIKSDDLWETIGEIDSVLPSRRIILLTRDFRDNLVSITRKNFGPVEPVVAARYVKERFRHYDAEFRRTAPEHKLHVRYEDLLQSPDDFVARMGDHFGLVAHGNSPPQLDSGHIRRGNVRKWTGLSVKQLSYCEAMLREELEAYGYRLECESAALPGLGARLAAQSRDAIGRFPQKLRSIGRRLQN